MTRAATLANIPQREIDASQHFARIGLDFPWPLVLENTIVGISYMMERRFIWANSQMALIFGYAPGELDGTPVRRLYVNDDDFEEVGRMAAAHAQHDFYTHERAMACKNGSLIWCRISGRIIAPADRNSPSVWVVQDLSDKKRAEDQLKRVNLRLEQTVLRRTETLRRSNDALRAEVERRRHAQSISTESRGKYRALFRNMPLGLLVVDKDGAINEVNRILQTSLGASNRKTLDLVLGATDRVMREDGSQTSIEALVRQYSQGQLGGVEHFEIGWSRLNGERREFEVVAVPVSNRKLSMVFAFTDVTSQRHAQRREHAQQEALTHASRLSLMGQMTSALAHELGQPLAACQSYVTGLRHRLGVSSETPSEHIHALDKAMAHLDQASEIIRNVRGFVSRHAPNFDSVDLPTLVEQTLALLDPSLRAGNVRVETEVDVLESQQLPRVRAHQVEIQQVLVNLVINGIEAMQNLPIRERKLIITMRADTRSKVSVEVCDRGPGVPDSLAPKLFEPYVTTKQSGLGMGLMICRTIVESHGGTIILAKSDLGARFKFTLRTAART